tara:strand:- start:126 stop:467 length:342 start_codon:yes stop_codon:yes gene_type:complete
MFFMGPGRVCEHTPFIPSAPIDLTCEAGVTFFSSTSNTYTCTLATQKANGRQGIVSTNGYIVANKHWSLLRTLFAPYGVRVRLAQANLESSLRVYQPHAKGYEHVAIRTRVGR